jgi:hypothetical protein
MGSWSQTIRPPVALGLPRLVVWPALTKASTLSCAEGDQELRFKQCFRGLTALACGGCLLQVGGCTTESLLVDVMGIALSAILTQLLGTPLL